jgi:single-strand DNA-binding protein
MNSLTITGNLGRDSETRYLQDGTAVCSFSVADSLGRDKPSIWWSCSFFGKRGESVAPYLTKGQQVTVVGSVSERDWVDKDGQKRKSMDVRVNDLALQGGKREEAPQQTAQPVRKVPAPPPTKGFDDMDDDIPF